MNIVTILGSSRKKGVSSTIALSSSKQPKLLRQAATYFINMTYMG
jgi:hypothetical protein